MSEILWDDGIDLGGTECETCGGGPEDIEVWAYPDGTYYVRVSVGCYSGE